MSDGPVAVCVDAGTTVIKAVVFDADGRERVVTRRDTAVAHPRRERAEQDMDEVWHAVVATVREAVQRAGAPVRFLALTAQGDGAWLVDAAHRPVRPAVLWNDGRAADTVTRWAEDGVLEAAYRVNGSLTNAGLPNAVLRHLADEEPGTLDAAHSVLTCGGWLFLRLTGVLGIDPSEASAPWLDIHAGAYSDDLLDAYGLGQHRRLLPPLLTEESRVAEVTAEAAERLGLPAGTPVVLAPYDIVSTALGVGATEPGQATCVLGTTLCTEVLIERPDTGGQPAGLTLDFGVPGRLVRAFPTLAGTGVLDWLVALLGLRDHAELTELAARVPAGAEGLRVLPYLSPAGERAPFLDPAASGLVTGALFTHGREHLARAVLEGLAHVIRDCLDAAPHRPVELGLCGGGAASDLWCQLIADITGVPAVRTEDSQVGAKGALLFASTLLGDHPDLTAAARALVRPSARREPDAATRAFHEAEHAEFLATRDLTASRWAGWRDHG
ncbi:carbohydrate kinase [Streptomyces sp. 3MP-14]|uniref:Carbohydrate kinase n=1 Tax=Streptomyces mimosae TaxID=2586635 RepID=A0A5N5ZZX6_9ACTN|nr:MULTISPECIES: FGGY-family carbohydrate kinase [Streptomyces]KAB8161206.1 carbohydrate kinase [Streptomyces mimosae]KAB8179017.1 carbohydrate kinase [Streptomyces sp. 3MP-14]